MIKSNTPVLTTLLLISGCFVILAVPNWVAYTVIFSVCLALAIQSACNHPQLVKKIKTYVMEFLGFCLLVGCFTGTMVATYGLLFS